MHLHEFLAEIHAIVKPRVYLEVGVQNGTSLNLAKGAQAAIGVDPYPLHVPCCNQILHIQTSDDFFAGFGAESPYNSNVDFGFIDGLHHAEQALRDFLNLSDHLSDTGIIVIDDVLPRNQEEANRVQCPGDWTGDVWKAAKYLIDNPGFQVMLVGTRPTGVLVVTGAVDDAIFQARADLLDLDEIWKTDQLVPDSILNRAQAWGPISALDELRTMPWQ